jgi:carbamoylphosphate synthase large subunit
MTDKTIRVLFTSVGRRVELMQAFASAAETIGCKLEIYGADITNTAPALTFCDHTVIVPRIRDAAYIPSLLECCENKKIDALIPTIDTDLLILAKNKAKFKDVGTIVVVSDEDKIAVCRDKRLTSRYFESVGLVSPPFVDDYKKYSAGFPAFIKPKDGSSSIFAYRVNDQQELESFAKQVPDYIIQPFIEGTEYTVDVFCDFEGNPIFITPRIRLAVRAGEVLKTKIVQDEIIIEEIKKLLLDYKPCGAITIQLIRQNETGKDYYIEINPRYGGGAPLTMKAGANSAIALLKLLNGEKVSYMPHAAEDGAVYCRFDQSIRVKESC